MKLIKHEQKHDKIIITLTYKQIYIFNYKILIFVQPKNQSYNSFG